MKAGKIFINYRREDSRADAGRLYDRLHALYPERVFRDVGSLEPGIEWREAIDKVLSDADACTSCKRCQDRCPAHRTGKPLSPMKLIKQIGEKFLAADPNVWSFIEKTPKGVSIHYLDAGIDTGDIIAQKLVETNPILPAKQTADNVAFHLVAVDPGKAPPAGWGRGGTLPPQAWPSTAAPWWDIWPSSTTSPCPHPPPTGCSRSWCGASPRAKGD